MRIAITGASGFIGSSLYDAFYNSHNVYTLNRRECELTDLERTKYVLREIAPDIVIHCAGQARPNVTDNSIIDNNITATHNVLQAMPSKGRLIFLSTIAVYGDSTNYIIEDAPYRPRSVYAATKVACEQLCRVYLQEKNISTTVLRLGAITGKTTHGMLHDIVRKLKTEDETLPVLGTAPGMKKPYLHIADLVAAVNTVVNHFDSGLNFYNICGSNAISTEDAVCAIMEGCGILKDIEWRPADNWSSDCNYQASCANAAINLKWKPSQSSEEAVQIAAKEIYNELS